MNKILTFFFAAAFLGSALPASARNTTKSLTHSAKDKKKSKARQQARARAIRSCKGFAKEAKIKHKKTWCVKLGRRYRCYHTLECKFPLTGQITVRNCSPKEKYPATNKYKYKITICVYNGGDLLRTTARHRKTLNPGKSHTTRCEDNRGGYMCKVSVTLEAGNACPAFGSISKKRTNKVSWGKTLYIRLVKSGSTFQPKFSTVSCPSAG